MKLCYIDFEFNGTSEAKLNLVSVAILLTDGGKEVARDSVWLHDQKERVAAKDALHHIFKVEGYTLVAYVAEAEARSLLSLGVDIRCTPTIDLYIEYRRLLNHNHELAYGLQYINGEIIKTSPPPPKWERTEEDDNDLHHKPSFSLAAACYKTLGVLVDTKEKNEVRDIIIYGSFDAIEAQRNRILKYNESDITHLQALLRRFITLDTEARGWKGRNVTAQVAAQWVTLALIRGSYAIHSAVMITRGYPICAEKVAKFTANVDEILRASAKECIIEAKAEGTVPFRFNPKLDRYSVDESQIRKWILKQGRPYWRKTEGGKESLSKDAFSDWFDSRSPGFAGAFSRYLKTKQSLNGFLPLPPGSAKTSFKNFVGKDNRVRPFMGIYGSQSSRSQPSAKGFIPLKSHWMRNFIEPPPGMALCGIDYASQEFLIAAGLSQDSVMIDAYASGDVYLAFGKAAKIIPASATKKTHPAERDGCKATVLGISYDMTSRGLAPRLSQALKRDVTEDEAQGYIDSFYDVYSDFSEWKKKIQDDYRDDGFLSLPDGWTMWGDNDNARSVGNYPVQGHGAVIMRRAVDLAEKAGCRVIFTLHDALYIEYPAFDFEKIELLMGAMQEAFQEVMKTFGKVIPIRLEGETWAKEYAGVACPVKNVVALSEYSDDKGKHDLEKFRKYFS